jgi:hypothetical protein
MTNKMDLLSLIYFNNLPLHVSNTLPFHHQEVALLYMQRVVFVIPYAACTVKLPHDDEYVIYSKHVEGDY